MGEMDGKLFRLSEIAFYYMQINAMLHGFEGRVVLLAILEHALADDLHLMEFESGGKHHGFLDSLVSNNILVEKSDEFVFSVCFISVLLEFSRQNNLRKILRDNIFERIKVPKNLTLSISFYDSKLEKYSKDQTQHTKTGDSASDPNEGIDQNLNIFKFLKSL